MVILDTERLILKAINPEDYRFIFELLNSPGWLQFIGDRGIKSEEDASNYIANNIMESYHKNGFGLYKMCLKEFDTPIGICGFIKRNYLDSADLGFAILPAYEGQGYSFEAASTILDYGQKELKISPVLAITTKDNVKSRNLLEKIGFMETGMVMPPGSSNKLVLFSTNI